VGGQACGWRGQWWQKEFFKGKKNIKGKRYMDKLCCGEKQGGSMEKKGLRFCGRGLRRKIYRSTVRILYDRFHMKKKRWGKTEGKEVAHPIIIHNAA